MSIKYVFNIDTMTSYIIMNRSNPQQFQKRKRTGNKNIHNWTKERKEERERVWYQRKLMERKKKAESNFVDEKLRETA